MIFGLQDKVVFFFFFLRVKRFDFKVGKKVDLTPTPVRILCFVGQSSRTKVQYLCL